MDKMTIYEQCRISIHALREEGDQDYPRMLGVAGNFYPRPPRGGRPLKLWSDEAAELFLSTPSARRATRWGTCLPHPERDFYPRPPRGGRHAGVHRQRSEVQFLSTPSARRATPLLVAAQHDGVISIHALREEGDHDAPLLLQYGVGISIHALREEGDVFTSELHGLCGDISIHALREEGDKSQDHGCQHFGDFYPRPPRGGRLSLSMNETSGRSFLSTPSARRATTSATATSAKQRNFYPRPPRGGRRPTPRALPGKVEFLSTPSARRATILLLYSRLHRQNFYPRPPRGGRHCPGRTPVHHNHISIHALREEGDCCLVDAKGVSWEFLSTPSARRATSTSTIQYSQTWEFLSTPSARRATRLRSALSSRSPDFYPRPPRGGRLLLFAMVYLPSQFLSTPSARRATILWKNWKRFMGISIHALREEGDQDTKTGEIYKGDFYPRPPRGGRRYRNITGANWKQFLSTPSARRATNTGTYTDQTKIFLSTPSARRAT